MRCLALTLIFVSQTASAKILDLYGQAEAGGSIGRGVSGAQKDNSFHEHATGLSYGALVGAEVLFVDAFIEHQQFRDGGGLLGTFTQFMAGFDLDIAVGDDPPEGQRHESYFEWGLYVGFGVGTGSQVEPPLDNSEISDKAFLAQLRLGGDYRFASVASVGLTVPITYGYMFKNESVNDESKHYQSLNGAALVYLRFHLEVGD
jgi:hypothetical protein